MKSKCNGILGFLLGHSFIPRYSDVDSVQQTEIAEKAIERIMSSAERLAAQTKLVAEDKKIRKEAHGRVAQIVTRPNLQRVYHGDLCKRCGEVIQIQQSTIVERRLETDL